MDARLGAYEGILEVMEDLWLCRVDEECAIGRVRRIIDSLAGLKGLEDARLEACEIEYELEELTKRRFLESGGSHLNAADREYVAKVLLEYEGKGKERHREIGDALWE